MSVEQKKELKRKWQECFPLPPPPSPLHCHGTFADWLEWFVNSDHTTSELWALAGPQPSVSPRR